MRPLPALLGGFILLIAAGAGDASTPRAPLESSIRPVAETISAGHSHACAVANGISVRCWGANDRGQLGNGTTCQFCPHAFPAEVHAPGSGVTDVAAGLIHTCLLGFGGGGMRCWGWNGYGQLGLGGGDTFDRHTPADVVGLSGSIKSLAAGSTHTCAVTGGGARCWGSNLEGELGNGQAGCNPNDLDKCYSTSPVTVSGLGNGVTQLAAGADHTCAVVGGGVRCWGSNRFGQLGNGGPTGINERKTTPVAVSGLSGVKAISAGGDHTCAVTSAGAIKCWGENGFGELGDGTTTDRPTPVTVALRGAAAIAAGWQHTCAITTKGGVICWGRNTYGGLGDGTTRERHRPVAVSGLGLGSGVTEITAGYGFTCARLGQDDVRCWGRNDFGQLGDGTTASRHKPVSTLFSCQGEAPTIIAQPGKVTYGTSGNDVIMGTSHRDHIQGKGGFDRICGLGAADKIVLGNDGGNVDGGAGNDEITGGDAVDTLDGGAGNDTIDGGKGGDVIDAFENAGDDKLRGGEGEDALHGGKGVDVLVGGEDQDTLYGGDESDLLNGGAGPDILVGEDDNDILVGGAGKDHLLGGDGDDVLTGGGGDDELDGGAGDDHVNGNGGGDRLLGAAGDDLLFGGGDSDFLFGNAGDDRLSGNDGFDILHGGPGTDHDDGGAGKDHCWGETFEACAEVHKPG